MGRISGHVLHRYFIENQRNNAKLDGKEGKSYVIFDQSERFPTLIPSNNNNNSNDNNNNDNNSIYIILTVDQINNLIIIILILL